LIRKRHLKASDAGKKLTRALLEFYQKNIPDSFLTSQLEPLLAYFLGKEASKAVGISGQTQVPGDILGLFLKFSGFKTFGAVKNHESLRKNLERQQIQQFGRVLQIKLPELNRS
jgi:hypothetical protein